MTLGTGLIAFGGLQVYQRTVIATGFDVPRLARLARHRPTWGLPNSLVALRAARGADHLHAALHRLRPPALRRRRQREGGAPLRRPVLEGDPRALRLLEPLAGITGLLFLGLIKTASLTLVDPQLLPSVAAAVIGGTSIFGGRGGYVGTIVGALILRVITTMLTLMQIPEGARMIIFGADRPRGHRRLPPHHRGSLTWSKRRPTGAGGIRTPA